VKQSRGVHREATLYHALAGAGAGDGRTLEQLREAGLRHMSVRASRLAALGLWDDEPSDLNLDALSTQLRRRPTACGCRDAHAFRAPPRRRIVQRAPARSCTSSSTRRLADKA